MDLWKKGCFRRAWLSLATFVSLAVLIAASSALADEIVSKGTTLHGKVKGLNADGVVFTSEYGEGDIAIKWEDIETVTTDGSVQILYGEEEEVDAPLTGKRDGIIVVGSEQIDVKTIHSGVGLGPDGPTWRDRLRSSWRYWDGAFDLGMNLQQSTTDTFGLLGGLSTTRIKGPSRLLVTASYRYSTEKKQGQSKSTIQDEWKGLMRLEYDFYKDWYAFGSVDGEYDAIERVSIRTVPKAGVGYTIWSEDLAPKKQNYLKAEVGGGWVYQRYFGGDDNDYFTVAFGALACYYLPYDSKVEWRFDYLPAVDDWANNYLLRNNLALTVPMFDPISAKFSLLDEYNNQPALGAAHNSLYIVAGISIGW